MYLPTKTVQLLFLGSVLLLLSACYKKDIQFASDLGETYTKILQVDTVSIDMSTVLVDSFATNTMDHFLIGRYSDTSLGNTNAKPFFQLALPADVGLENEAVYDSLTFVVKLNGYYYGDTTKSQTIIVSELAAPIEYTYGSGIYNTSTIAEKASPLGSRTLKVGPLRGDSITVRLSDIKGAELFSKLKTASEDISTATSFLNYFKGISLSFGTTDASALYGFNAAADSVFMRLHYHTNMPLPEKHYKDFSFNEGMYFNQILSDRSATALATAVNSQVAAEQSGNHGYTQGSTGALLKLTFPTLRSILQIDPTVKLLKATLLLKVTPGTTDKIFRLPPALYMAQTDATNTMGSFLSDSTGEAMLYSTPVVDPIYSTGTYYAFNLTSYINTLLTNSGTESSGLFVTETAPGGGISLNRAVFNNSITKEERSRLVLSLLTLKN